MENPVKSDEPVVHNDTCVYSICSVQEVVNVFRSEMAALSPERLVYTLNLGKSHHVIMDYL